MTNSEELDFDEILQKWESMSSEITTFQNENNFLLQLLDKVAFYKAEAEYATKRKQELDARVKELETQSPVWGDIESAPKYETLFLIRKKTTPHVVHEAMVFRESESWEMPQEYDVLQDMTFDEPIDDCSDYEWAELPKQEAQDE